MADARLRHLQSPHDVCRAQLGRGELLDRDRCVRELCGGGVLQMPADGSVLQDERLAGTLHNLLADTAYECARRV